MAHHIDPLGLARRAGRGLERLLPPAAYLRLKLGADRVRDRMFRPYTARRSFGGHSLLIDVADRTARAWYDYDWPMPGEIDVLRSRGRLKPGAVVFDVGAHQGVVAMILARIVGPGGRVVAVEAGTGNARTASRNLALNDISNVHVIRAAAGAASGVAHFVPFANGYVTASRSGAVSVPQVCVDGLVQEHGAPDVIFVDVEGSEIDVLKGAANVLERRSTDLFIEVHAGGRGLERFGTVEDLLALIPAGYEIVAAPVKSSDWRPLAEAGDVLNQHAALVALAPNGR